MGLSDEMRRVTDQLREAERTRLAEAAEAARQRAKYVDDLRASTASLRKEHVRHIDDLSASVASMRKELASEIAAAHKVWDEFSGRARPMPAGVTAASIPRAGGRGRFILGRGSRE